MEATYLKKSLLFLASALLLVLPCASISTAQSKDVELPYSQTNSLGMRFVLIKPGSFTIGAAKGEASRNDERQVQVVLTKPFYIGQYEVTVEQYRMFAQAKTRELAKMLTIKGIQNDKQKTKNLITQFSHSDAERGEQDFEEGKKGGYKLHTDGVSRWRTDVSWKNPGWNQSNRHPAVFLSWNDGMAFSNWLSEKEGKRYRLPTEAEWEFVCRGGTTTAYWWGNEPDTTGKVGNLADTTFHKLFPALVDYMNMNDGFSYTAPVGSYRPNPFGVYDIIGNAFLLYLNGHHLSLELSVPSP